MDIHETKMYCNKKKKKKKFKSSKTEIFEGEKKTVLTDIRNKWSKIYIYI